MSVLAWLIVGAIGGWLSSFVVRGRGILGNLITGVVGAMLMGWLSVVLFGIDGVNGIHLISILFGTMGAIVVSVSYSLFRGIISPLPSSQQVSPHRSTNAKPSTPNPAPSASTNSVSPSTTSQSAPYYSVPANTALHLPNANPSPRTLSVGATLQNRYRIVSQLGSGGQASVYLAQHLGLGGKYVALKQNVGGDPQQFQNEAILLANLAHPNLPRVLDHFVEPNGTAYLVMDYEPIRKPDLI